ncbi:MAG: hypothetical protein ACK56I_36075, partial [bacterium]
GLNCCIYPCQQRQTTGLISSVIFVNLLLSVCLRAPLLIKQSIIASADSEALNGGKENII